MSPAQTNSLTTSSFTTVHYPESDGRPMGETDLHREAMIRHIELLKHHFAGQQVYVSGDLLVYFEQGNPKRFVVPDAFIAKGLNPHQRRVYKTWVEARSPDAVIETTSRKTKKKDTTDKPALYAQLGVKEYFLFDPTQDYLDPPLQGHRLVGGTYELIQPEADGSLLSQEFELRLRFEDSVLAFYRLDTGERVLTAEERTRVEVQARRAAEQRTRAEAEARQAAEQRAAAAEAEIARLRQELARRSQTS
jgi:Uma2 family endonuclease